MIKLKASLKRKAMANLDIVLKSRNITLSSKCHIVKAMVLPVATYRCETWSIKKAQCQRTDTYKSWCWRRLLKILESKIKLVNPKGNQPRIFVGRTDAKAEAPILWSPDMKS